jgi:hypothetical protein
MKVCLVGAELFHTGRQTDKSNTNFLQFSNAPKNKKFYELYSFACMDIITAECNTKNGNNDMLQV